MIDTVSSVATTNSSSSQHTPPPPATVLPGQGGLVATPSAADVLCGRGGRVNAHEGNVDFRRVVEEFKREYLARSATKTRKARIAAAIVARVRRENGRFLRLDAASGSWVEIGDEKARRKAGQALREDATQVRRVMEGGEQQDEDDDGEEKEEGKDKESEKRRRSAKSPRPPPRVVANGAPPSRGRSRRDASPTTPDDDGLRHLTPPRAPPRFAEQRSCDALPRVCLNLDLTRGTSDRDGASSVVVVPAADGTRTVTSVTRQLRPALRSDADAATKDSSYGTDPPLTPPPPPPTARPDQQEMLLRRLMERHSTAFDSARASTTALDAFDSTRTILPEDFGLDDDDVVESDKDDDGSEDSDSDKHLRQRMLEPATIAPSTHNPFRTSMRIRPVPTDTAYRRSRNGGDPPAFGFRPVLSPVDGDPTDFGLHGDPFSASRPTSSSSSNTSSIAANNLPPNTNPLDLAANSTDESFLYFLRRSRATDPNYRRARSSPTARADLPVDPDMFGDAEEEKVSAWHRRETLRLQQEQDRARLAKGPSRLAATTSFLTSAQRLLDRDDDDHLPSAVGRVDGFGALRPTVHRGPDEDEPRPMFSAAWTTMRASTATTATSSSDSRTSRSVLELVDEEDEYRPENDHDDAPIEPRHDLRAEWNRTMKRFIHDRDALRDGLETEILRREETRRDPAPTPPETATAVAPTPTSTTPRGWRRLHRRLHALKRRGDNGNEKTDDDSSARPPPVVVGDRRRSSATNTSASAYHSNSFSTHGGASSGMSMSSWKTSVGDASVMSVSIAGRSSKGSCPDDVSWLKSFRTMRSVSSGGTNEFSFASDISSDMMSLDLNNHHPHHKRNGRSEQHQHQHQNQRVTTPRRISHSSRIFPDDGASTGGGSRVQYPVSVAKDRWQI